MSVRKWFDSVTSHLSRPSARRSRRGADRRLAARRLLLEGLEERCLLTSYVLTLLDGPEGSVSTEAHDINASGQVVGTAWIGEFENWRPEGDRALLWSGGIMIDLGTLGGQYSSGKAINDLGQIVGSTTRPDNSSHGFLINPEDSDGDETPDLWFRDLDADGVNDLMVELPMLPAEINNGGQVVGGSSLWTPATPNGTTGTVTNLGLAAHAINDLGHVVGKASIGGADHAVLWQSGLMTDLGAGSANAINASGQVTGYSASSYAGFLWTPTTSNGSDGTFSSLPGIYGGSAEAYAAANGLNNVGQVVGISGVVSSGGDEGGGGSEQVATLWVNGSPQDLNALDNDSSLLEHADAINDAGEIVGHTAGPSLGTPPWQAFLLTPTNVPSIAISDVTVTEGDSGTVIAVFTVSLSAACNQKVTVAYATANGTATAGSDYEAASGTVMFAAGESTKTVTVLVNGDRVGELNETFFVNLSDATDATVADGQGLGSIVDDEPRMAIGNASVKEGRRGKTLLTFTVTLSAASDAPVSVNFATQDGTAKTSDNDYVGKSGTLTFAAGETSKTITIEIIGDRKKEADEYFFANLSGVDGALLLDGQGIGTILNDDK